MHPDSIFAFDLDMQPYTYCHSCFEALDQSFQRNLDKLDDIRGDPIQLVQPHYDELQRRVTFYTLLTKLCLLNQTENPMTKEN